MDPHALRYSKEHLWLGPIDGEGVALIGVSHHAQESLGDIVFVELPAVGADVKQGAKMGEIESLKATSDLISPITGRVLAINQMVAAAPQKVNEDPYGDGWLLRVRVTILGEVSNLLPYGQYLDMLPMPE